MKKGIVLLLISLCVFFTVSFPLEAAVSLGTIDAGCSQQVNNNWIYFSKTFQTVPTIVVSAQRNLVPLVAGAYNNTNTGFGLKLYDLNGNPVTNSSGVWVQWVAISPNSGVAIRANCQYLSDGTTVTYNNIGVTYPVAVCSAQGSVPLLAAAVNTGASSFTLSLKDLDGNPASGWVQYIVINPYTGVNYYQEASILSGCALYDNGSYIGFDLTRYPNGIVCSAQKYGVAHAAAAMENGQYRFIMRLADHAGNPATQAWGSWLAVGLKY